MSTRFALGLSLYASLGVAAIAADNPTAGTWELNNSRSTIRGCPSDVLRQRTLAIPPNVITPATTPRAAESTKPAGPVHVASFDVSPDGRILIMTPANIPNCSVVYERR